MPLRALLQAALLAALTAILAYIRIPLPFTPVPITGQSIGVMLAGIVLGARWASVSMTFYLLLGLIGIPVYAGGMAGFGVLFGPTGGYIWGFIFAAAAVGWLAGSVRVAPAYELLQLIFACVVGGMVVLYTAGSLHFAALAGIPVAAAISATVLPFILGDVVKVAVAAVGGLAIRRALRQQGLLLPPASQTRSQSR